MNYTSLIVLIVTMLTTLLAAIFTPTFIASHPLVFAILAALAQLLHNVLPSSVSSSTTTKG